MEDVMKLLVAIDSSPVSKPVVEEVARRPWPPGSAACVLHVIDWPPTASRASLLPALQQLAGPIVKEASEKLGKAGLQTAVKVLEGDPRIAVSEYAQEWGADLVLVGWGEASGLVRFLLGSVAQAVLRRSLCSVEIVRRPAQHSAAASTAMKILLGVDGSDCSMVAVRSVAQHPWPPNSQMRVISVIPLVIPTGAMILPTHAPVTVQPSIVEALQKEARDRGEEAFSRARQILGEAGIKVVETESLPVGDARQVILDQAKDWGADLIVVGSHGYRGVDRFMLGSVSESVAMHAHTSVEIIRE
jgi:nucleotide-binding universal stress UspA family protein